MSNELHKISTADLPNEFAITNETGDVLMLVLATDSGYINVDFRGIKIKGARVFELGGPEQDDGPTMDGRIGVDIPESDRDVPTFLSIDGDFERFNLRAEDPDEQDRVHNLCRRLRKDTPKSCQHGHAECSPIEGGSCSRTVQRKLYELVDADSKARIEANF